jgi:chaperonin cofactor prefoldin
MDSIDSQLMKWFGEIMLIGSSNVELWKSMMNREQGLQNWEEILKVFPGLTPPPVLFENVQEMHRQWLALFNAVPKSDYDALQDRLETIEAECETLKNTLQEITTAMVDFENLPKKMAPWLELGQDVMKRHIDWLGELGKNWQSMNVKEEPEEKSDTNQDN